MFLIWWISFLIINFEFTLSEYSRDLSNYQRSLKYEMEEFKSEIRTEFATLRGLLSTMPSLADNVYTIKYQLSDFNQANGLEYVDTHLTSWLNRVEEMLTKRLQDPMGNSGTSKDAFDQLATSYDMQDMERRMNSKFVEMEEFLKENKQSCTTAFSEIQNLQENISSLKSSKQQKKAKQSNRNHVFDNRGVNESQYVRDGSSYNTYNELSESKTVSVKVNKPSRRTQIASPNQKDVVWVYESGRGWVRKRKSELNRNSNQRPRQNSQNSISQKNGYRAKSIKDKFEENNYKSENEYETHANNWHEDKKVDIQKQNEETTTNQSIPPTRRHNSEKGECPSYLHHIGIGDSMRSAFDTVVGAWLKDSSDTNDARVWGIEGSNALYWHSLREYNSDNDFIDRQIKKYHEFSESCTGLGQIIHRNYLYCQASLSEDDEITILKIDLRNDKIVRRGDIKIQNKKRGGVPYKGWAGIYLHVQIAFDEKGLWLITGEDVTKRLIIFSLDPETLRVYHKYDTDQTKDSIGPAFMMCGVLYALDSHYATYVSYVYDTNTQLSTHLLKNEIDFPLEDVISMHYNPHDSSLYIWRVKREPYKVGIHPDRPNTKLYGIAERVPIIKDNRNWFKKA